MLCVSFSAQASPSYPSVMRDHWELDCLPRCSVCHETEPGRQGNASRPFAQSLLEQDLLAQDEDSLRLALDRLREAETDSDGDGASDYEELTGAVEQSSGAEEPSVEARLGNPNGPEDAELCAAEVVYGCGASWSSPQGAASTRAVALLTALLGLGLGARRVARRTTRSV